MVEIKTSTYWKFRRLDQNFVHLLRKIRKKGKFNLQDANGPFWIFGRMQLLSGSFEYVVDEEPLSPKGKTWGFCLAPFSITQVRSMNPHLIGEMLICPAHLSPGDWDRRNPILFDVPHTGRPLNVDDLHAWSEQPRHESQNISRSSRPDPLAARIKNLLDRQYNQPVAIADLAQKLRIRAPSLSRAFKRSYGMSAIEYRTWLRVMTAGQLLLRQNEISDVFQDVGFGDLSRFYKQFKNIATVSPGRYSVKTKKDDLG